MCDVIHYRRGLEKLNPNQLREVLERQAKGERMLRRWGALDTASKANDATCLVEQRLGEFAGCHPDELRLYERDARIREEFPLELPE